MSSAAAGRLARRHKASRQRGPVGSWTHVVLSAPGTGRVSQTAVGACELDETGCRRPYEATTAATEAHGLDTPEPRGLRPHLCGFRLRQRFSNSDSRQKPPEVIEVRRAVGVHRATTGAISHGERPPDKGLTSGSRCRRPDAAKARTLVYIHGIGNKPEERPMPVIALAGFCRGERSRMVLVSGGSAYPWKRPRAPRRTPSAHPLRSRRIWCPGDRTGCRDRKPSSPRSSTS